MWKTPMKHVLFPGRYETLGMAPANPAALEKAAIPFCLTATELKDTKQFLTNLRKAIEYGLRENKALEALTKNTGYCIGCV